MNEKTFNKRINNMEKALYKKVFIKSKNLDDALKKSTFKYAKWLTFAYIRYTLVFNCLIKAKEENIYNEIDDKIDNINIICHYLDKIIERLAY